MNNDSLCPFIVFASRNSQRDEGGMSLLKRRASGPFSERSNLDPHRLNLHFLDPLSSKIMASDDQDSVHRLNIRHQDLEITYGTETPESHDNDEQISTRVEDEPQTGEDNIALSSMIDKLPPNTSGPFLDILSKLNATLLALDGRLAVTTALEQRSGSEHGTSSYATSDASSQSRKGRGRRREDDRSEVLLQGTVYYRAAFLGDSDNDQYGIARPFLQSDDVLENIPERVSDASWKYCKSSNIHLYIDSDS